MGQKKNQGAFFPEGDWQKTISDLPVSDMQNTTEISIQSAYILPEIPDDTIGVKLGSGIIKGFLGEGGMARVYKTWDEGLEIHRAVKVLLPTGKKEIADRFITEAKITARLDHPNIVKVFRVGKWNEYPFMEMEFIDGMSLEAMLEKRGSFPAYAVCAVGIFIARALHYAHELEYTLLGKRYKGLIHRDLKPANIMLRKNGRLKLMDFGIARPLSTGLHNTMAGNIIGTLPYLSPEQLNSEPIDHRADIYAVGAILYELLCGIKAFPDERLTELFNKKTGGIYKPLGEIPLSVPQHLIDIIDRCLRVKKEDRYHDADALHEALGTAYRYCADEPPEKVVEQYVADPEYRPRLTTTIKKRKLRLIRFRIPRIRFSLPHPPKIRLPEFSWPRLPVEPILKLIQSIFGGIRAFFKVLTGFVRNVLKMPLVIIATTGGFLRRIPKIAYGISGGLIITGLLGFYISQQDRDRSEEKRAIVDKPPDISNVDTVKSIVTLEKPEVISPVNDEPLRSETLTVVWNRIETANSYMLHLSDSEDLSDTLFLQSGIFDTSFAIINLAPGTHYCRVGATDIKGGFSWSTPNSFIMAPKIPELSFPLDGMACSIGKITFEWENVLDGGSYRLMVSDDSTFEESKYDTSGYADTSITWTFRDSAGMMYFWRVRLEQELEEEGWSAVHSFSVQDFTPVALSALGKNRLVSAEEAINKIPSHDVRKDALIIRLAEKYVETGNVDKAEDVLNSTALKDVLVDCLISRILFKRKKYKAALEILDTSVYSKTLFTSWQDSSNILYWRAVVTQKVYDVEKDKKIGKKAYDAWKSVEERYRLKRKHSRYFAASENMNKLYYTENVFRIPADSLKLLKSNR